MSEEDMNDGENILEGDMVDNNFNVKEANADRAATGLEGV